MDYDIQWPVIGPGSTQGTYATPPSLPPTSPMIAGDVEAIINKAIEIDPVAGNALKAKVIAGDVGFSEYQTNPGPYGVHDHNTISINTNADIPLEAQAVAALHEAEHLDNASPASGGDGRAFTTPNNPWGGEDPCFACTHASMSIDSFNYLNAFACEPGISATLLAELCDAARNVGGVAATQSATCLSEGCSQATSPSWVGAVCSACP